LKAFFGFFAGGWEEVHGDEVVDRFVVAAFLECPDRGELSVCDIDVASLDDVEWITNRLRTQNSKLLEKQRKKDG
jgi:hypothetical protein